jgi:hypothetical protein
MTGFNLPPGCNVSDIPGNRPEDEEIEVIFDAIYDHLPEDMPDDDKESLAKWIMARMADSYDAGYKHGQHFEALAQELKELKG